MSDDQDQAPENTERADFVTLISRAITKVGWDLRMQDSAANLAEKLTTAVEQLQGAEETSEPL
jgi:hypothetical protein